MTLEEALKVIESNPAHVPAVDLAAIQARAKWCQQDARPNQLLPPGNDWDTAIWIAGRFFGKTRTLVEAAWWEAYRCPGIRIHALAPTLGDVRRVLFEGESGFMAKIPPELLKQYNKDAKEIILTNGSMISGFSVVEEADRLRGPQCHLLIFDEAAAADRPVGNLEAAYRVAALGVRLPYPDGTPSRKLVATTPKPIPFLKRLIKREGVVLIQGTSLENKANVASSVMREVLAHQGTSYGKQEIYGQFIDDEPPEAIFKRNWFRLWPANRKLPVFSFVLEVYDTAFTEATFDKRSLKADPTGGVVLGVFDIAQNFTEAERRKMNVRGRYAALLCDAWTEYLGFPDLLEKARTQHRVKWGGNGGRRGDVVLIEDKGSGISLRQALGQYGVPTWPYNPHRESKTTRAHAVAPLVMQGCVFIPESAREDRKGLPRDWVEPFLEQVCSFFGPGTTEHDEFVDCVSSGLIYLRDRSMLESKPEKKWIDPDQDRDAEDKRAFRLSLSQQPRQNPYG